MLPLGMVSGVSLVGERDLEARALRLLGGLGLRQPDDFGSCRVASNAEVPARRGREQEGEDDHADQQERPAISPWHGASGRDCAAVADLRAAEEDSVASRLGERLGGERYGGHRTRRCWRQWRRRSPQRPQTAWLIVVDSPPRTERLWRLERVMRRCGHRHGADRPDHAGRLVGEIVEHRHTTRHPGRQSGRGRRRRRRRVRRELLPELPQEHLGVGRPLVEIACRRASNQRVEVGRDPAHEVGGAGTSSWTCL